MKEKNYSTQNWIQIEKISENGIIKIKNKYIKIIKVLPINFNLKSNFEKESILNSYKIFLKTCNFNLQILIQSNKEDLQKNIKNIYENLKKENNEKLNEIGQEYISFINKNNTLKTSSTKDFYIIISTERNGEEKIEDLVLEELNDKYFKIKECLLRCGNNVKNINSKSDVENIIYSFFNTRLFIVE